MFVELSVLVVLVIVIVVLFNAFSTEKEPTSPKLTALIGGFGLFVGIALLGLSLAYFQTVEAKTNFLLAFTTCILFPIALSSAAATFISIRSLKETIASA